MKIAIDLAMKAAARLRITACKIVAISLDYFTAFAAAQPSNSASVSFYALSQDNETSVTAAGDVDKLSRHSDLPVRFACEVAVGC